MLILIYDVIQNPNFPALKKSSKFIIPFIKLKLMVLVSLGNALPQNP